MAPACLRPLLQPPCPMAHIHIVTVNYRTPDHVCRLIQSLLQQRCAHSWRMSVVDNCSGDGSVARIEKFLADQRIDSVRVIASPRNAGYAAGNNLALNPILAGEVPADYIWLLNPDTEVGPGAVDALVDFLASGRADIVGSRLEDRDGTPQVAAFRFPNAWGELSGGARLGALDRLLADRLVPLPLRDEPFACDWLAGASVMMTRQALRTLGPMDEVYFLYYEEVDYFVQAQRRGLRTWHVPASRIFHEVGASTGISNLRKAAPRRPAYWFESRRRFFLKNFGKLQALACDLLFVAGYSTWLARKTLTRAPEVDKEPPRFLRDFLRHSCLFQGFGLTHEMAGPAAKHPV